MPICIFNQYKMSNFNLRFGSGKRFLTLFEMTTGRLEKGGKNGGFAAILPSPVTPVCRHFDQREKSQFEDSNDIIGKDSYPYSSF